MVTKNMFLILLALFLSMTVDWKGTANGSGIEIVLELCTEEWIGIIKEISLTSIKIFLDSIFQKDYLNKRVKYVAHATAWKPLIVDYALKGLSVLRIKEQT